MTTNKKSNVISIGDHIYPLETVENTERAIKNGQSRETGNKTKEIKIKIFYIMK